MENPAIFVESFGDFRSRRSEGQIAINVVFDERDFAGGEHLNEFLFLLVRHATPKGITVVEGEDAGFDATGSEALFEFIKADAFARISGNFADAHAERFNDLQNAKERGRFDGDNVAGIGDGAKAKVEGFSRTDGGDDVVGRKQAAGFEGASGNLDAKSAAAGRRIVRMCLHGRAAANGCHHAGEFFERKKFSAGQRRAELYEAWIASRFDDLHDQVADLDLNRARSGVGHCGLGRGRPPAGANIIAGLGASFEDAAVFKQSIRLSDSGNADVLLLAAFANGRDALAWTQGAVLDEFGDAEGDLFIKDFFAVQLRGGMGGQVLRQHSEKVSRNVPADNDTLTERGPVQFWESADCSGEFLCNLHLVAS